MHLTNEYFYRQGQRKKLSVFQLLALGNLFISLPWEFIYVILRKFKVNLHSWLEHACKTTTITTTIHLFEKVGDISPVEGSTCAAVVISRSVQGNPDSGIRRYFAYGIRNPESWALNCGIQCKESGIQVPLTKNPQSTASESKVVLVSFNGVALNAWQISLGYRGSTRMDSTPSAAFNADVRAYLNERWKERRICVSFSLKTPMKKKLLLLSQFFLSFRKVNFCSNICWFPVLTCVRSFPVS